MDFCKETPPAVWKPFCIGTLACYKYINYRVFLTTLFWPILTIVRFLIFENFQKYIVPYLNFQIHKITTDSEFKDAFEH